MAIFCRVEKLVTSCKHSVTKFTSRKPKMPCKKLLGITLFSFLCFRTGCRNFWKYFLVLEITVIIILNFEEFSIIFDWEQAPKPKNSFLFHMVVCVLWPIHFHCMLLTHTTQTRHNTTQPTNSLRIDCSSKRFNLSILLRISCSQKSEAMSPKANASKLNESVLNCVVCWMGVLMEKRKHSDRFFTTWNFFEVHWRFCRGKTLCNQKIEPPVFEKQAFWELQKP